MPPYSPNSPSSRRLASGSVTRRRFLESSIAAASSVLLTNCARNLSNSNPQASSSPTASNSPTANGQKLYIYTWANYIDEPLTKEFQKQTGIQTVVDVFDSNEAMLAKIQAGGGNQYSIIYPSDYMVIEMTNLGLLTELDKARLSGLSNLRAQWQDPVYDKNNAHSIPAVWGTTGLIYSAEKLGQELQGWDYIWDNAKSLNRQVTLINDVREVMGATLMYLGYPLNSSKDSEIQAAYNKLLEIKPAIAAFLTNGWEDQLASGDISIAMAYSTDALNLMNEKSGLKYVIPKTGASIWTDTMVIPKAAPNPDAAYQWLAFMLQPDINAQLVDRLQVATPNQKAYNDLPSKLKENTTLFPPEASLEKCEGVAPLPEKTTELYDRYWTQLTSS